MNEELDIINANFKVERKLWKEFKQEVKRDNSDASKMLRIMIKTYLKHNEHLINK